MWTFSKITSVLASGSRILRRMNAEKSVMEDLDDLMHTFEELQDKFAADPDLELKLQD